MNWLDFLKEGETTVDVPQEAPDVLVVKAIVDRDLASLKKAISLGGSVRQTIGKEKFAVFAFRHFDKDVINFCKKKKCHLRITANLLMWLLQTTTSQLLTGCLIKKILVTSLANQSIVFETDQPRRSPHPLTPTDTF